MDRAERKAATAVTPSAASEAVKDAQRALDAARRMRGPAGERASLVRELERKLERVKRAADSVAPPQQATAEQTASADRLSPMQLGVPAHQMTARVTRHSVPISDQADVGRVGRVITGFTVSQELKNMPSAERTAYAEQVVQDTSYLVPRISGRRVDGVDVGFGVEDGQQPNFGWDPQRLIHTATGDAPGRGGHSYATFNHGNARVHTEFPPNWYLQKIAANSYEVLGDLNSTWQRDIQHNHVGPGYIVTGMVDGIRLAVVVEPYGVGIVTAFPR